MDSASDQLLTSSAFTADQNCGLCRRDLCNKLIHRSHPRTLADHIVFEIDVGLQFAVFVFQPFDLPSVFESNAGSTRNTHHQLKMTFVKFNFRLLRLEIDHTRDFAEQQEWYVSAVNRRGVPWKRYKIARCIDA